MRPRLRRVLRCAGSSCLSRGRGSAYSKRWTGSFQTGSHRQGPGAEGSACRGFRSPAARIFPGSFMVHPESGYLLEFGKLFKRGNVPVFAPSFSLSRQDVCARLSIHKPSPLFLDCGLGRNDGVKPQVAIRLPRFLVRTLSEGFGAGAFQRDAAPRKRDVLQVSGVERALDPGRSLS